MTGNWERDIRSLTSKTNRTLIELGTRASLYKACEDMSHGAGEASLKVVESVEV